jgi:hypothetical protein
VVPLGKRRMRRPEFAPERLRVADSAEDEEFELGCGAHEALDVFRHPYAYAATRPVLYRQPTTVARI